MKDLLLPLLHLAVTAAKLCRPGGTTDSTLQRSTLCARGSTNRRCSTASRCPFGSRPRSPAFPGTRTKQRPVGTRLRQLRPTGGTPANAINLSGTEPPIAKRRLRGVMPCVQSSRSSTRSCSGPSLGPSPSGQDYVRSVDGSAARRRRCRSRCASRWGTPPSRHDRQYRR